LILILLSIFPLFFGRKLSFPLGLLLFLRFLLGRLLLLLLLPPALSLLIAPSSFFFLFLLLCLSLLVGSLFDQCSLLIVLLLLLLQLLLDPLLCSFARGRSESHLTSKTKDLFVCCSMEVLSMKLVLDDEVFSSSSY